MAKAFGIRWQNRGPRPENGPMPKKWKGGTWRPDAQRWAVRGGQKLRERNAKYGKGGKGGKGSKGKDGK